MNLRGRHREDPEINFIPLIDVLLVILIFLMVTTTYQRVAELQITLPEADAEQAKQRPSEINVGVDAQGRYVDRQDRVHVHHRRPRSPTRCSAAAGDAKDPVIIINADANATHQSVIHVMEAARLAGLVAHHVRDADRRHEVADRAPRADRGVAESPRRRAGTRRGSALGRARAARRSRSASFARAAARARSIAPACCASSALPVPVVVVGNITVGGTGKTPLVLRARRARSRARGFRPAHRQPRLRPRRRRSAARGARRATTPARVGDEPLLLARRSGVPVWIARDRAAAARALLAAHPDVRRRHLRRRPAALRARARRRDRRGRRTRAASATACCCRPDRCASRRRGSTRSTRSCV